METNDPPKCRRCGCTGARACQTSTGPCFWFADNLCSACVSDQELFECYQTDCHELRDLPVKLASDFTTMLCVVSALQLAFRHPRFQGPTRQVAEEFAHGVAATLARRPAVRLVLERGFIPAHDVPPEDAPRIILPGG